MSPEKFGSHLDLLKILGFQTISLARLHRVILGQEQPTGSPVVVTFDDCTLDNWVYAVPELLRRNMQGVFFAMGLLTGGVWLLFGASVRRWLRSPQAWQGFNFSMAGLTAACVLMLWW